MRTYDVYLKGSSVHTILSTDCRKTKRVIFSKKLVSIPEIEFKFSRKLKAYNERTIKTIVSKVFRKFLSFFDSRFSGPKNLSLAAFKFYQDQNILYGGFWTNEMVSWLADHVDDDKLFAVLTN